MLNKTNNILEFSQLGSNANIEQILSLKLDPTKINIYEIVLNSGMA